MNPTTPIAIEGDHFVLHLCDSGRKHIVEISINEPEKLVALLQARRNGALRIAEPGSPTQWQVDRPTERAQIDAFCADRRAAIFAELGL